MTAHPATMPGGAAAPSSKRLLLVLVLEFISIGIMSPLVPYFAVRLGASASTAGLLTASYSLGQFIMTPVLGRLSDKYGRRPILLLGTLGAISSHILLATATSIEQCFLSRIVGGLTSAQVTVARAYLSDISGRQHRANSMGILGAAFGIGFVIGPVVGGILASQGKYSNAATTAMAFCVLEAILILVYLPESRTGASADSKAKDDDSANPAVHATQLSLRQQLTGLFTILGSKQAIAPVFRMRFLSNFGILLFHTTIILHARNQLGFQERETGMTLAYVGVLVGTYQGYVLRKLRQRFSDADILYATYFATVPCLLAWAFCPSGSALVFILLALTACKMKDPIMDAAITKLVDEDQVGLYMGIATSSDSVARILASSAGGFLLTHIGPQGPGVVGAVVTSLSIAVYYALIGHLGHL